MSSKVNYAFSFLNKSYFQKYYYLNSSSKNSLSKEKNSIGKFFSSFSSVHSSISLLRSYNCNPDFFLSFVISENFNEINKNILKNFFIKTDLFDFLWIQVEKMLVSGFISFSKEFYYRKQYFGNLLVEFLFEVFFSLLDEFFCSLSNLYNSRKTLLGVKKGTFYEKKKFFPVSVKLIPSMSLFGTLKTFCLNKLTFLSSRLKKNGFSEILVFERKLYYIRYKYHGFLTIVGSKEFAFFLRKHFLNFLKSNLHLSLIFLNFFNSNSKNIFFLGFNVCFSNDGIRDKLDSIKANKKYLSKIMFKIELFKIRTTKLITSKIYFELFTLINRNLLKTGLSTKNNQFTNFWLYLFQLEAIHSTQINRLVLMKEKKYLISNELINAFCSSNYSITSRYFFKIYFNKLQFVLFNIISHSSFWLTDSFNSLDLEMNFLFLDFRKKLFLFYNNFYSCLDKKEFFNKILKNTKLIKLSSFYNLSFSNFDIMFIKNSMFYKHYQFRTDKKNFLDIFLSFDFCLTKLRDLGFIHPTKYRPVSNSKYLLLEDKLIVEIFGYFAYMFLYWFKCVKNISDVKYIIELIRQSCFLTLCRKHNKHKTWAFDTYSVDLVVIESLCFHEDIFPKRFNLQKLKRKFLSSYLFFDEKYFL